LMRRGTGRRSLNASTWAYIQTKLSECTADARRPLRCLDRFAGAIVDRFGRDVLLRPSAEGYFDVTVRVFVSVHFYAWIFGFTPDITIVSPDSVKEEFVRTASETLSLYK